MAISRALSPTLKPLQKALLKKLNAVDDIYSYLTALLLLLVKSRRLQGQVQLKFSSMTCEMQFVHVISTD